MLGLPSSMGGQDGPSLALSESVLSELGVAQAANHPFTEEEIKAKGERTSKNHIIKGMLGLRTPVVYYHPGSP